jgi:hypothetical protein
MNDFRSKLYYGLKGLSHEMDTLHGQKTVLLVRALMVC